MIDIDGVICTQKINYEEAEPIQNTIDLINALYDAGNYIIFYTARGYVSGIDWRDVTLTQFFKWGVKYHELIFGKPAGEYYIDDRNLCLEAFINGGFKNGIDCRIRN
ncbi:hypothetical protein [Bacteroides sp.]|uniref:hypothetical protein n=1 Tax=Bacteroides sp. TaxID=29523 RepID=UPI002637B742|nr:hypothetical protein [Bacteroides sp.]MDD3039594.1 hypothetical protein [Bacteroides sp.]